jgi:hypothetical protein
LNVDDDLPEEGAAVVVDDRDREVAGVERRGESGGVFAADEGWNPGFTGTDYLGGMHWTAPGKGEPKATWTPDLPATGRYAVYVWYGADNNNDRASNAPFTVRHKGGSETFHMNMKENTGQWNRLGEFEFQKGTSGAVELSNDADGFLAADAVKFLPVEGGEKADDEKEKKREEE